MVIYTLFSRVDSSAEVSVILYVSTKARGGTAANSVPAKVGGNVTVECDVHIENVVLIYRTLLYIDTGVGRRRSNSEIEVGSLFTGLHIKVGVTVDGIDGKIGVCTLLGSGFVINLGIVQLVSVGHIEVSEDVIGVIALDSIVNLCNLTGGSVVTVLTREVGDKALLIRSIISINVAVIGYGYAVTCGGSGETVGINNSIAINGNSTVIIAKKLYLLCGIAGKLCGKSLGIIYVLAINHCEYGVGSLCSGLEAGAGEVTAGDCGCECRVLHYSECEVVKIIGLVAVLCKTDTVEGCCGAGCIFCRVTVHYAFITGLYINTVDVNICLVISVIADDGDTVEFVNVEGVKYRGEVNAAVCKLGSVLVHDGHVKSSDSVISCKIELYNSIVGIGCIVGEVTGTGEVDIGIHGISNVTRVTVVNEVNVAVIGIGNKVKGVITILPSVGTTKVRQTNRAKHISNNGIILDSVEDVGRVVAVANEHSGLEGSVVGNGVTVCRNGYVSTCNRSGVAVSLYSSITVYGYGAHIGTKKLYVLYLVTVEHSRKLCGVVSNLAIYGCESGNGRKLVVCIINTGAGKRGSADIGLEPVAIEVVGVLYVIDSEVLVSLHIRSCTNVYTDTLAVAAACGRSGIIVVIDTVAGRLYKNAVGIDVKIVGINVTDHSNVCPFTNRKVPLSCIYRGTCLVRGGRVSGGDAEIEVVKDRRLYISIELNNEVLTGLVLGVVCDPVPVGVIVTGGGKGRTGTDVEVLVTGFNVGYEIVISSLVADSIGRNRN